MENREEEADDIAEHLLDEYQAAIDDGDTQKAMEIGSRLMAHAAATKPPRSKWVTLADEADEYVRRSDWLNAERAYREAISVGASENRGTEVKSHCDLSRLLAFLGRNTEALDEANAAVEVARSMDFYPVLMMALDVQIGCLLKAGEAERALAAANEAIAAAPENRLAELMHGRLLTDRALCYSELGNTSEASRNLESAWRLLEPYSNNQIAAGGRSALGTWFDVDAKQRAAAGDLDGAVESAAKAVEHRRAVDQMPQVSGIFTRNSVASALQRYGKALEAVGKDQAAAEAFTESCAIRDSIGLRFIE
jgi:tetratricopeptide (TPR) repeat protein